ncbi:MAG TPA: hypothetical protein VGG59_12520 [Acidobacteriaceae bacterium]
MSASEEQLPDLPEGYLSWNQKRRIMLPSEEEEYMLVPVREIQRLRGRVTEELPQERTNYSNVASSLFGAAVAIGASIPFFMWANGLPMWLAITYMFSAGAFFAIGLIFAFISRDVGNRRARVVFEISKEMLELEERYRGKKTLRADHDDPYDE